MFATRMIPMGNFWLGLFLSLLVVLFMTQPVQWEIYLWGVATPAGVFFLLAQKENLEINIHALARTLFNIAGLFFFYAGFIEHSQRHSSVDGYFTASLLSWLAFTHTVPWLRRRSNEISDIEYEITLLAPLIVIPLIWIFGR